jgi:hypothetical protein
MQIECSQCEMYRSAHCDDCLVTSLLHPPDGVVDIDEELDPGLRALSGAGLIPILKFRPRADPVPGTGTEDDEGIADAG